VAFDFDAPHPYIFAQREPEFALFSRSKSGRRQWVRFG